MSTHPGRVDSRRPVPVRLGLCIALLSACATSPPPIHRELTTIWRDYRELPAERALAIAGDLRNDQWVAGAAGGRASRAEAKEAALAECSRRRAQRRMQMPCGLYAVGDEVVWPRR